MILHVSRRAYVYVLEAFSRLSAGRTSLSLRDLELTSLAALGAALPASLTSLCLAGNCLSQDLDPLVEQLAALTSLTELDISRCRFRLAP